MVEGVVAELDTNEYEAELEEMTELDKAVVVPKDARECVAELLLILLFVEAAKVVFSCSQSIP